MMRKIITRFLFLLLVFIFSCKRDPATFQIHNLNDNKISVFGHAGMGFSFQYPIDTYESIEPVLRIGADGSEMDLQVTRDSVLVVYHDQTLEDMTLCTTGMVNDKFWTDIWGCHIACPYSSSVKLICFNDLMNELTASGKNIHNYTFTFDCKLYSDNGNFSAFRGQYANTVLKVIDDNGLQNNVYIESQDTTYLRLLMNKRSGLKLFIYPPDFATGLQIAKSMKLFGITISNAEISAAQVKIAHDNGIHVTIWGVSTEQDNIDAIQKSPDFIQTDKPVHLLKVFGKYKG
jgi:glycerophosphoryl diester phosphodiesterase